VTLGAETKACAAGCCCGAAVGAGGGQRHRTKDHGKRLYAAFRPAPPDAA
jgi:hypothetical protein